MDPTLRSELTTEIYRQIGRLIWHDLSSYAEDNPKTTPRKVLKDIAQHEELLQDIVIKLDQVARRLK